MRAHPPVRPAPEAGREGRSGGELELPLRRALQHSRGDSGESESLPPSGLHQGQEPQTRIASAARRIASGVAGVSRDAPLRIPKNEFDIHQYRRILFTKRFCFTTEVMLKWKTSPNSTPALPSTRWTCDSAERFWRSCGKRCAPGMWSSQRLDEPARPASWITCATIPRTDSRWCRSTFRT